MIDPRHDGAEAPTVHTRYGDVPAPILIGGDDSRTGRRNLRLKKVLALIALMVVVGLIVTFILDIASG